MTARPGRRRWRVLAAAVAGATVILLIGGLLTDLGPWYRNLKAPPWKPPDWLFAPIWTLIYALWVAAVYFAWKRTPSPTGRAWMIAALVLNGVLNVAWSVLFFKLHHPDWAAIELLLLWLSVLAIMVVLGRASRLAGLLLVPYLAWVSLAGLLNLSIVRLNYAMLTGEAPSGQP